jgi:hypothetical protein
MYMSEHEKFEQVGRLAEEYSKLKGELNHVDQKAANCHRAYQFAASAFPYITVQNDQLFVNPQATRNFQPQVADLPALLGAHQLLELLKERDRLRAELQETGDRLKALAPHLIP